MNEARVAKLAKRNADLAAKAAAGDKAEAIAEETAPAEEAAPAEETPGSTEPAAEDTASETVAEDKPQE